MIQNDRAPKRDATSEVGTVTAPLTELTPDEHNANAGTERGRAMVGESLRRYGAGRSILVDRNGNIIAGNTTHEAAIDIGLTDAVIVKTDGSRLVVVQRTDLDLDSPAGRALAVADNRTSEVGLSWDPGVLAALTADAKAGRNQSRTRDSSPSIQSRRAGRPVCRVLEQDQIDRICAALEATETSEDADGRKKAGELANVVRFAFATGWRTASEVLPLEWKHVDWKARTVRLDPGTTKNGEGRSFPFTAKIETVLKEQLKIHEALKQQGTICPYVFHRKSEKIVHFRAAWRNACKAAGCAGALVHDMRRSAVRTFDRAGVPRSVAMSIVGHKTESIYRRYAIVDEAMQQEAAIRLDEFAAM